MFVLVSVSDTADDENEDTALAPLLVTVAAVAAAEGVGCIGRLAIKLVRTQQRQTKTETKAAERQTMICIWSIHIHI